MQQTTLIELSTEEDLFYFVYKRLIDRLISHLKDNGEYREYYVQSSNKACSTLATHSTRNQSFMGGSNIIDNLNMTEKFKDRQKLLTFCKSVLEETTSIPMYEKEKY